MSEIASAGSTATNSTEACPELEVDLHVDRNRMPRT
jgi:hypothetical protein